MHNRTCILLSTYFWHLHWWDQAIWSPHRKALTPALVNLPKCDTKADEAEASFTSLLLHRQFSCETTWTNSELCPATTLGSARVLDSPKRKAASQISRKHCSTCGYHSTLFLPSSWPSLLYLRCVSGISAYVPSFAAAGFHLSSLGTEAAPVCPC